MVLDNMIMNNPLNMNDWKFSRFIKAILLMQLLMFVVIGLGLNNITIPIITPLITFIYLTFIPGFLILRIFRMHKLGNIETILYAVGVSILSLMFTGLLTNTIYPLFGIYRPITLFYLSVTISLYVLMLCILSYIMDRNYYVPDFIDVKEYFNSRVLFLCILPFLAIFGSYSLNFYDNNLISMFLFSLIALTLILVIFDKIPKKLYSFTIWIVAISLLYVTSLISPYVWGWDIQNEFYLANLVIQTSHWNYSLPDAYNAMLSIVMVAPIYSIFTSISLDHVFKIIYAFLLSLVPLGLYKVFKIQTNPKIAFSAVFLFMSSNTFYIELLSLGRQIVAELFLVLMLLLIFSKKDNMSLRVLFILFGIGLIVSHYTVTYFFIFALLCIFSISILFHLLIRNTNLNKKSTILLNGFIPGFLVLFTYLWYTNIASGYASAGIITVFRVVIVALGQKIYLFMLKSPIIQNVHLILLTLSLLVMFVFIIYRKNRIVSNIKLKEKYLIHLINQIIDRIESKINHKVIAVLSIMILIVLGFLTGSPKTWIVSVLRYLNFIVIFLSVTGFLYSFIFYSKNKIQKEYFTFSAIVIVMLIAGILLPYFEAAFHIPRIFHISFIFLTPFCIIGGLLVVKSVLKTLNKIKPINTEVFKLFSVFLLIFMLFNTGFVSVIANQSIPMHLTDPSLNSDFHPRFDHPESLGAKWLAENKVDPFIYADVYGVFAFYRHIYSPVLPAVYNNVFPVSNYNDDSYIYLRRLNLNNTLLIGFTCRTNRNRVYKDMSSVINPKNRIYENGGSRIYHG